MTERYSGSDSEKKPKLPFSETRRVYREGVENLIRPLLADPQSELSRKLEVGEAAFVDTGNDGGNRRKRRLIPIALPIDYQRQKLRPENVHNMAQVFLNKVHLDGVKELDGTLQEVGDYYFLTREAVRQNVQKAFRDALVYSTLTDISIESFEFRKPLSESTLDRMSVSHSGFLLRISELLRKGADYSNLKEEGFTAIQIVSARRILAKRRNPINVPRSKEYISRGEIIGVLTDPEIDRIVKRELILEIPLGTYNRYSNKVLETEPVFVSVAQIADTAELSPNYRIGDPEFLADYLVGKCIPVGDVQQIISSDSWGEKIRRYRFVLLTDKDVCVGIFRDAKGERFDRMRSGVVSPGLNPV